MTDKKRRKRLGKRLDQIFDGNVTYKELNDALLMLWIEEGLLETDHLACSVTTGMGT